MIGSICLYFGWRSGGGHHLQGEHSGADMPWDIGHMDSGLLCNGEVPDRPDGRVFWTCGGGGSLWFAFYWWDRSGDSRGSSNSGFYVRGFGSGEQQKAFEYACLMWPDVVKRQRYPLVLQP